MVLIKANSIKATRGDDILLSLSLTTPDGQPFPIEELEEGQLVMNIRRKPMKQPSEPLLKKDFELYAVGQGNYIPQVHIESQDTKFLQYGSYLWDCQYTFETGGKTYVTTVCTGPFELTQEIG